MELVEARRIWNQAPHNAFTDLIRFAGRWFCVFREGQGHISPDGALRVIASPDGDRWESAALIRSPNSDLRDAKITVTPDGRLMLCGAEKFHDPSEKVRQSLAWFSDDGYHWSEKHEIAERNYWLWRVTWHRGKAYGVGYLTSGGRERPADRERLTRLYASDDGKDFEVLVPRLFDDANESSIVFDGDTALCLLRRDREPRSGLLGASEPPYTEWEWKDLGARIGGPHMLLLPDGRLLAAVRLYDEPKRTSLCWLDRRSGKLAEALALPSGGDTSYAGLVPHDGLLWVSYYSSHEEKTSIYLAKVKV